MDDLASHVASVAGFVDGALAPKECQTSADQHAMALKLLNQSLSELEGFLKSPNEDTLSDATISLGEGLKHLTAAQEALKKEFAKE